jgi:hypothetical protein
VFFISVRDTTEDPRLDRVPVAFICKHNAKKNLELMGRMSETPNAIAEHPHRLLPEHLVADGFRLDT